MRTVIKSYYRSKFSSKNKEIKFNYLYIHFIQCDMISQKLSCLFTHKKYRKHHLYQLCSHTLP